MSNENETRASPALWLAGANEQPMSAKLALPLISLNVKLTRILAFWYFEINVSKKPWLSLFYKLTIAAISVGNSRGSRALSAFWDLKIKWNKRYFTNIKYIYYITRYWYMCIIIPFLLHRCAPSILLVGMYRRCCNPAYVCLAGTASDDVSASPLDGLRTVCKQVYVRNKYSLQLPYWSSNYKMLDYLSRVFGSLFR